MAVLGTVSLGTAGHRMEIKTKGYKTMTYEYSWSGPKRAVSAEKVAKHIAKLEKKYGEVSAEVFLESARSEKSEMHTLFEWDDKAAAEKYRIAQARIIISSIRVNVVSEDTEPVITKAFVQYEAKQSGYISICKAMEDKEKRENVMEQAKKELRWFTEKYKSFDELSGVIDAINAYLEETA